MQVSDEAEPQDEESTDSLGQKLKSAREAQGLSLDKVASELRIGAHLLGALEECRFESLDAPVFAKGYLKQYAARLGLDVAELAAEFDRSVGASAMVEIALPASIRLRDDRQIKFWVAAGVGLAVVAGLLGTWWWLGTDPLPPTPSVSVSAPAEPAPTLEPVPASEPVANDATEPDSTVREPPAGATDVAGRGAEVTQAEPALVTPDPADSDLEVAESLPSAEPVPVSDATTESGATEAVAQEAVVPGDGPVLEIIFNEDSWAEVTNSAGQRLYYNLGRSGTRARVAFDGPLNLFFGYAAGVELTIDGEPVPIPSSAVRGDLAQFDLDPTANPGP